MTEFRNVYEWVAGGVQWSGCDCVSREEADQVAEIVSRSGAIRRIAVIRCHPRLIVTVNKL